jgi:crotonobetainyl-CoA:carnitine CoA-transferase CaiB-like acyl-CoA transferase
MTTVPFHLLSLSMDRAAQLPLRGLQVVECASYVAGPTGGLTLAQLGAQVTRIDPLGGANDQGRWPVAPGGMSYYWASLNKGKRAVAIDMRSDEGRELVVALITAPGPGAHPVLADVELGASGPATSASTVITARSPLRWNGGYGEPGQPPVLGRDTEQVLAEVLGLTAAELARLRVQGVIAAPREEGAPS